MKNLFFTLIFLMMTTAYAADLAAFEPGFDAARAGDLKELKGWSQKKEFLNLQTNEGYTPLILAAYHGHVEAVKLLLNAKADACISDQKGNTALMGTIYKGEPEVFEVLVTKCDVNHRNYAGQTALMYASLFGREAMAKALIRKGADANLKDQDGKTAMNLAESQWNQSMIKLLKFFKVVKK